MLMRLVLIDSDSDSDAPGIDAPGIDSDSDSDALILDKKYPARGGALFIKYKCFLFAFVCIDKIGYVIDYQLCIADN